MGPMLESVARPRVLSVVLAGGEGKRLLPLTKDRAKPAVPFGGQYRLIDFALSNLANGGYRRIVVLTQYKSHSLDVHLARTWRLASFLGNYVTSVPAQMRKGREWFRGSADALYQNLNIVDDERPQYVFVFGADHVYRLDPRQLLDHHIESGAGVTVAALRVPREQANQFGVARLGSQLEGGSQMGLQLGQLGFANGIACQSQLGHFFQANLGQFGLQFGLLNRVVGHVHACFFEHQLDGIEWGVGQAFIGHGHGSPAYTKQDEGCSDCAGKDYVHGFLLLMVIPITNGCACLRQPLFQTQDRAGRYGYGR